MSPWLKAIDGSRERRDSDARTDPPDGQGGRRSPVFWIGVKKETNKKAFCAVIIGARGEGGLD